MNYKFFRVLQFDNNSVKASNISNYDIALLMKAGFEEASIKSEIHTVVREGEQDNPVYIYRGFTITNDTSCVIVIASVYNGTHFASIGTSHPTLYSVLDYIDKYLDEYARNFLKAVPNLTIYT